MNNYLPGMPVVKKKTWHSVNPLAMKMEVTHLKAQNSVDLSTEYMQIIKMPFDYGTNSLNLPTKRNFKNLLANDLFCMSLFPQGI
jgi:hypothetical protein